MSWEGIAGVAVGAAVTVFITYFEHKLSEKREKETSKLEYERRAISRVFSPMVFILDYCRGLFVKIVALHEVYQKVPETKKKVTEEEIFLLNYFTLRNIEAYPKKLADMLKQNSEFIENGEFYNDVLMLQSYMHTIVRFLHMFIRSGKSPTELRKYLSALGPLTIQLDEAIGKMRQYCIAKTVRLEKYSYERQFTEQKYVELERYVDEVDKIMTGEGVPEWGSVLKKLSIESTHDQEEKKE